ncbi:hypothetical protein EON83_25010 [bacterium]|nr:MAG: hypothetical protein EON83_25010 [bacterium]
MKTSPLLLGVVLLLPVVARAEDAASCAEFNALVAKTYNFDESRLTLAQKQAKEGELNNFWTRVKANKTRYLPCLRAKLSDAKANPFFRFDGSNLLVEISPTLESKRAQVEIYSNASLDLVGVGRWTAILTLRGTEGFDVSKAAKRALDDEDVNFVPNNIIPEYADETIYHHSVARLLWCSQSEERATPKLFALVNNPKYAEREAALSILLDQATPGARAAILTIKRQGLSAGAIEAIDQFLRAPEAVTPRAKPKTTRAQFIAAFNRLLAGDSSTFLALSRAVSDGERDAAAVLLPSDLPLLYRVRRRLLLGCNNHSLFYYHDLTGIIFAVMAKQAHSAKI